MQIIEIKIESKSKDVATCNACVIKINEQFRYLFVPKLVDNIKDDKKCISGQFIIQKKGKNEKWENYNFLPLNKLEKEKWINLDLSTSSLDMLISYITELKLIYQNEGKDNIFNSIKTFVFSSNLSEDDKELITEMFSKNNELRNEFKKVLNSEVSLEEIIEIINNKYTPSDFADKIDLDTSNALYSFIKAKLIKIEYLEENMDNSCEEFWQKLFVNDPNILFSIIPSVSLIIQEKPFVGGKAIDNVGGKNSDFLFKFGLRNTSLIEIKTPMTKLMIKGNREGVYIPSSEFSSSILQLKLQKDNIMKEYYSLKEKSSEKGINFESYDPKCYLIIGDSSNFDFEQTKNFELFRNELKDIEIITFNELVNKLKLIKEALESN